MNRMITSALIGCLALSVAGCPLTPTQTTIELVNAGSFPVEVTLYISDTQEIPEVLLTTLGTEIQRTVPASQTVTIAYECDELQAVIVDDADLQLLGEIGPQTSSDDVLRDGTDFGCGDTIRFSFSHPLLPTRLDLTTTVVD